MGNIQKQLVTRRKELEKKLVTSSEDLTNYEVQIRALGLASGLTKTESGDDLTGWYCKAYRLLGEGKYSAIVSMARKGNKPQNLFGWLLKQEIKKHDGV